MAPAATSTGDYVVVSDRFPFTVPHPDDDRRRQYRVLARGDEVSVEDGGLTQEQADRGVAVGALAPKGSEAADGVEDGGGGAMTLEQALAGSVEDVVAYLGQHPDELDDAYAAELDSDRPRKGVLELNPEHDHEEYLASREQ